MKEILDGLIDSANAYTEKSVRIIKQGNLTLAEWRLLQNIISGENTQEKLSAVTKLDTSTLSRQLKRLLAKQMIIKVPIGDDKRQLIYSVTENGVNVSHSVSEQLEEQKTAVFNRWTEEETRLLKILINRLDNSINRS
ncbi:MarR family winged helix-turn-helix transcriptional regulator [Lentilactobacillus sp. SPB1-3]|uniref:MarR family winged helix-turn-helix transcriptional regulator n=1 Tax=Lentilactobacillus terminaliae TaxID=3003483 RepID=A0ACD5DCA3_9LACO|nr:MarR family winged helix-turn-helix transcriptional regulator [Lentilactobacillus sp. SPB1-3]MCZ0977205.1 MarR family winged helix-turn-helix transcriptional regulator [Lentilactobacillus sp. SPB1-3]